MVAPADSTLAWMRKTVRRLTASGSESALSTSDLDEYINNFITQDFPYAIKLDQMRSVYRFFTEPYVDRYPIDVNNNQGIRAPVYVDGLQATLFKDRQQFYAMWPRWPTSFTPAGGDGVTVAFSFTLTGPLVPGEVTMGTVSGGGAAISVADDGEGTLRLQTPNPQVSDPAYPFTDPSGAPIPGMYNLNTGNPGLIEVLNIGTVNYITGAMTITFPVAPGSGEDIIARVVQYQPGRPYSVLFWNNELIVRPIPKEIHKIELESYLTPVQMMETSDVPILNQWSRYISLGSARHILEDRGDYDGRNLLDKPFMEQEALVLERQGVEEIGQRNSTVYTSVVGSPNWGNSGGGFWA